MPRDRFSVTENNEGHFYLEGEDYYARYLQMIQRAQRTIHLHTYIFEMDRFGSEVTKELVAAASRGVKVFLLVDGVGSKNFTTEVLQDFQKSGMQVYRFNEIHGRRWIGDWGRRLHHKVLIADDAAMVGGINVVSLTYNVAGAEPHLDFAVYITGGVVTELQTYCEKIFCRAAFKKVSFPHAVKAPEKPGLRMKISINDWTLWKTAITRRYSRLVADADKNIVIVSSYFFPRRKFMKQLAAAARRGVRVRIILPKYSDWPISVLASQYLYSYFLKRDIEIYQWKSSVLHGKMATVDNRMTTVGSFNLHYTAYQQNLEMNVDVFSKSFTEAVNTQVEAWIVNSCEKASLSEIANAPLKIRILRVLSYLVMSLVANFSVAVTTRALKTNTY